MDWSDPDLWNGIVGLLSYIAGWLSKTFKDKKKRY